MSAREELARVQAELLRALGEGGVVPEGFDAERVRATADALVSKRRRQVERAWPALVAALGERFGRDFEAWAREHPLRDAEPHPRAEGRRFLEALRGAGRLSAELEANARRAGLVSLRGPVPSFGTVPGLSCF